MEHVICFLAGGLVVLAFAVMGDILLPKSFAGLFGAAPSVVLVTLGLTLWFDRLASRLSIPVAGSAPAAGAVSRGPTRLPAHRRP